MGPLRAYLGFFHLVSGVSLAEVWRRMADLEAARPACPTLRGG